MTKRRPIQIEAADAIVSRYRSIIPPDLVEEARRVLQDQWIPRLRKEVADAHPDRGGTSAGFIEARKRYVTARMAAKWK